MKRIFALLTALLVVCFAVASVSAAEGNVTYDGDAKEFIFAPGSEYSVTDLFPDLKDVMPGDSITQRITVKNDVSKDVKVKIYMRSLGAHEDSVEFLNQMDLTVTLLTDTKLFEAPADQTAQLTEWTYLGLLYSGGEAELEVTLDVPVTMSNEFQEQIGYLDWEFMIEEYPVEEGDPKPPATGDVSHIAVWTAAIIGGVAVIIIVVVIVVLARRKGDAQEENADKSVQGKSEDE